LNSFEYTRTGSAIGQVPFDFVQSEPMLVTHLIDNQIYIIMALFKHKA